MLLFLGIHHKDVASRTMIEDGFGLEAKQVTLVQLSGIRGVRGVRGK